MERLTYDNPRGRSFPRLRRAMWIVIVIATLTVIGAVLTRGAIDPYSRLSWRDMPAIGIILTVAPIVVVAAANVLGWVRVSGFLAAQTIGFRIFVIVCVALLFAVMSAMAFVVITVLMYAFNA